MKKVKIKLHNVIFFVLQYTVTYRCKFKVPLVLNKSKITKLKKPSSDITVILKRLSVVETSDLCGELKLEMPKKYPFIFKKLPGSLKCYNSKQMEQRVRDYLYGKDTLKVPKHIVLKHNGKTIYLGPEFTELSKRQLARNNLLQMDTEKEFIISRDLSNVQQVGDATIEINPQNLPRRGIDYDPGDEEIRNISMPTESIAGGIESTPPANNPWENSGELDDYDGASHPNTSCNQNHNNLSRLTSNMQNTQNADDSNVAGAHGVNDTLNTSRISFPNYIQRHFSIIRDPERASCFRIRQLIHCTKKQFLTFVDTLKEHVKSKRGDNTQLSIYSKAFIYRLKEQFFLQQLNYFESHLMLHVLMIFRY